MSEQSQITLLQSEVAEWKKLALALGDLIEDENARLREMKCPPLRIGRLNHFLERQRA